MVLLVFLGSIVSRRILAANYEKSPNTNEQNSAQTVYLTATSFQIVKCTVFHKLDYQNLLTEGTSTIERELWHCAFECRIFEFLAMVSHQIKGDFRLGPTD